MVMVVNSMNTGVYMISFNKDYNIFYIGSASKDLFARMREHRSLLNNNKHHSPYFQRLWNKYGSKNFTFSIIMKCEKQDCVKNEQYYLDTLKPCLNVAKVAGSTLGVLHTEESKAKLRKGWERRKLRGEKNYRITKVIRSDGIIFESLTEAGKSVNSMTSNITAACKKGMKIKGYYFQYFDLFVDWSSFINKKSLPVNARKIVCIQTNKVYESGMEVARSFGKKGAQNLFKHLKGKAKSFCGYTFKYYKEII